ncbi:MAG: glycosyltransferase, partial [Promethearchaeota archaeon]
MADPKITVLMPVYNNEKFLRESVDSILNQTFKDFEFIIINDGSTDRTKKILNAYKDFRIRVIDNDKNIGITRSLNKGLGLAKGEYIARMDGDDISLPERLERQVKFLENNPKVVLLGNWVEIIDGDGNLRSITRYPTNHCFITWIFLFKTCLAHPTVMYRKKEVLKINGYNSMLSYTQDYDLWVRLSKIGKIG